MNKFHDVDGVYGRKVLPLPHTPLVALENLQKYDQLSMEDRLNEIDEIFDGDDELRQIMDGYLSQNSQSSLAESGFMDHLRWWALGDYESQRLYDKTSRFKIDGGTSALAQAILDDCRDIDISLSTPIRSIDRTNVNEVIVTAHHGQTFTGRTVICTVPLNTLADLEFLPALEEEKRRVASEGQCRGGIKFAAKLENPIGSWFCLAPNPNPIIQGFTDDEDGSIFLGFGSDDLLDIHNFDAVQRELRKFIPDAKVKYVVGHDWRHDPYVKGTWSWFRAGQMSANLESLQRHEPPVFFASSDISNGWRGFIDGALDSGLSTVRHVLKYLQNQS